MMRNAGFSLLLASAVALSLSACAGGGPAAPAAGEDVVTAQQIPEEGGDAVNTPCPTGEPEEGGQPASERPAATELEIWVEGEAQKVAATLYLGDGYSIYIPDEGWNMAAEGVWVSKNNEQAALGVEHQAGSTLESTGAGLMEQGYIQMGGDGNPWGGDDAGAGISKNVQLHEGAGGVWSVWYQYPFGEGEEGWGSRLPFLTETFEIN